MDHDCDYAYNVDYKDHCCRVHNKLLLDQVVSSLTSIVKTIEVDPRVPGNRDEFPFPQASSALQS